MSFTMYDSITPAAIPPDAQAVAGYVGGKWPTFASLAGLFPRAARLSIAVFASEDAECLDIEKGDATNAEAAAWVKRQIARGVVRPVVYTSVSNAADLLAMLAEAGIPRSAVRLWTAHYTYKPHVCSSVCWHGFNDTADATQYDDHALGRNLDASLCNDDFLTLPTRKPAAVLRAESGFWAWLGWTLGRGDWKGWGAFNPQVRPNVPKAISPAWWTARLAWLRGKL